MRIVGDGGHALAVKAIPLNEFQENGTIVAIGDNATRKRVVEEECAGHSFTTLIHPFSWVADDVKIGEGTVIMAGAVIQPGVVIGKHVIVNTGATVDHGCQVGDYVHLAPGVHLCGNVRVGEGALVGVGNGIPPGVEIEPWTLVKCKS